MEVFRFQGAIFVVTLVPIDQLSLSFDKVGAAGFEPTTSTSLMWRAIQAALRPELRGVLARVWACRKKFW